MITPACMADLSDEACVDGPCGLAARAAAFHLAVNEARDVTVSTMPIRAQPPMPKNMTIFCTRAKILMPKTTNRKPTTLKSEATMKVCQLALVSQLAASLQPK